MKRLFAILLVLTMVFSMSVVAMAAGEGAPADDGVIKITNATIGKEYSVYKIFDAYYSPVDGSDTDAVSYRINLDNQFFEEMFGEGGKGYNFFTYDDAHGYVVKHESVTDSDLVAYLTELVKNTDYTPTVGPIKATEKTLSFTGLPYGYYVITSDHGAAVTITSAAPSVDVIDKNQKPGDLVKEIKIGTTADGEATYGTKNTAYIGDEITYRITMVTANYDGDKKIKAYQIHDEKGAGIWADFHTLQVKVGGDVLPRGYFLNQSQETGHDMTYLGDWSGFEGAGKDKAQWYVVFLGNDSFRITIPWLKDHSIGGSQGSYTLVADMSKESLYDSPSTIEITYDAIIESNAAIGNVETGDNLYNRAYASWLCEKDTQSTGYSRVETDTFGIGLLKDDAKTKDNLAGAKFRLYSSVSGEEEGSQTVPVYLVPTATEGVYKVDSYGRAEYSEDCHVLPGTSRDECGTEALSAYLNGKPQDNYVVTPVNGIVIILGLQEGTYYLEEVEAPHGYNPVNGYTAVEVGADYQSIVPIYVDGNGKVGDVQNAGGEYSEQDYLVSYLNISNSQGAELPSTGGETAVKLITFGSLLTIAFAVLLITHKKMSVYKD